jgi:hypothetical protein
LTREDYYGRSSVIKTRYLDTIVQITENIKIKQPIYCIKWWNDLASRFLKTGIMRGLRMSLLHWPTPSVSGY